MTDTDWDERFASGEHPRAPEPSPVLRAYEPSLPDGRALDVAAGTGRNAVFLADRGYDVDALDRFADLIESLAPDGFLFAEGHLRSADASSGPSGDRYRYVANELLRAGSGLSVRCYDETTTERPGGRRRATARLLAQKSTGGRQSYPPRPDAPERWPGDDAGADEGGS